jgi:hypothetical protein
MQILNTERFVHATKRNPRSCPSIVTNRVFCAWCFDDNYDVV